MLMYPLQEAVDLLTSKLNAAKKSMDETVEDLEFLREQATVMEVNFARVHNVRGAGPLFLPSRPFASCATYSAVTVYMDWWLWSSRTPSLHFAIGTTLHATRRYSSGGDVRSIDLLVLELGPIFARPFST
jgi:hypothetical protein